MLPQLKQITYKLDDEWDRVRWPLLLSKFHILFSRVHHSHLYLYTIFYPSLSTYSMQLTLTKSIQDALVTALCNQPDFSPACQREAESAVKASLNEDYGISLALLRELATFLGKKQPGNTYAL